MTTPRLLSERYELGEVLGYGGMSEVHRGLDTRLGRDVAVKVLRADLARDPQFQMRFRREAQNAASLNHPAIVSVYDTGEVQSEFGPLPYIVMEYVDGQTLREIVKTTGPMTQQKVIEVMADVCAALDFSHRHNIIHRDVKPANIMINRAGAVKVMDFGIARALGEGQNVTQTAAVIGTAQYLSPEQARGEAVDARSDVYAAGCVLFELLTGEPPFTGDTPVAVAYQHVREDPRHPSELNPSIPPALDAVALKALSKNPVNRYQSAAEMRTDLVRVRSGQAPLAPTILSEDERTALMTPPTAGTRRINGSRPVAPVYDDYYEDEPRRGAGRIVAIVLGVLLVLGLVGFVAFQLLRPPPPPLQIRVPGVAGQTVQQAGNQIISLDLQVAAQPEEVASDVGEIGKVVGSTPGSGTLVPKNSVVKLQVGRGPDRTVVPRLQGQTPQQVEPLLSGRALKLGTTTEQETGDANLLGKVISSAPEAGEEVAGQSAVNIVVGKEKSTAQVPNVQNQDAATAQQTLQSAGFKVGQQQVDNNADAGTVLGTNPATGTTVQKGSTVNLQISRGPQNQTVPDVVGQKENDAKDTLRGAGYRKVNVVDQPVLPGDQDGIVLRQSPDAGQTADPGQEIQLLVGKQIGNGNN